MSKALVVLSGGQDSTTCLFNAKREHTEVRAICINYGQRHQREIQAASVVAGIAGVDLEIIHVPGVLIGASPLVDQMAKLEQYKNWDALPGGLEKTFVPMRNTFFLTIAANRAVALGADAVITGVTAADFVEFGEFSWPWLGGFVDAEACFVKSNTSSFSLNIYQKDPEAMHRLGDWLKEQRPELTYGFSISKDGVAELSIAKKSFLLIADKITPHLHLKHRRDQGAKWGAPMSAEAPLCDAYVAGFWEGDGGCYSAYVPAGGDYMTRMFEFIFYQKDAGILHRLRDYLDKGSVGVESGERGGCYLKVSDGPKKAPLLERLKPHLCIIGSFEKITKYRHKIDFLAGGFCPPYPDCTPDFVWAYERAMNESLKNPGVRSLKVETPVLYLTKAESIELALTTPGCYPALAYSHTAYDGAYPPTGHDHATLLRAKGFAMRGVPDPLIVRAYWERALDKLPDEELYHKFGGMIDSHRPGYASVEGVVRGLMAMQANF